MTILVAIDDTRESEAALPLARRLGPPDGAGLVLVSIGELPETSEHAADERDALGRRLRDLRERYALPAARLRVELAGDPAQGLVQVAEDEGADRILLSTSQATIGEEIAGASVVEELSDEAQEAGVRVLVVRTRDGDG